TFPERRPRDTAALDATLGRLGSAPDLAGVVRHVVEYTKLVTSAEALSLLLHDGARDELVFAATETLEERALASHETPLPPAVGALISPERLVVSVRN